MTDEVLQRGVVESEEFGAGQFLSCRAGARPRLLKAKAGNEESHVGDNISEIANDLDCLGATYALTRVIRVWVDAVLGWDIQRENTAEACFEIIVELVD